MGQEDGWGELIPGDVPSSSTGTDCGHTRQYVLESSEGWVGIRQHLGSSMDNFSEKEQAA